MSKQYDFFKLFDGMVVSSELKRIKPDPEIFRHLLEGYSLNPQETVFIDDVKDNTEAAQKLGIVAIQFTTPEALRKELERLKNL
jgi:HAD superfamily hydrolase (TIGR01509 family)